MGKDFTYDKPLWKKPKNLQGKKPYMVLTPGEFYGKRGYVLISNETDATVFIPVTGDMGVKENIKWSDLKAL